VFGLSCLKAALEVVELDSASLWWAGKEIARGKKLCDFVGKNEKTKIMCKLQKVSHSLIFCNKVLVYTVKKCCLNIVD